MGPRQGLGARWTWRQRRGGRWYHSQPDYCLARAQDIGQFRNVAFRQPRIHDSDHQAVVASISRGRKGRLKKYQRRRQKFSLTLLPVEEQDGVTRAFGELRKTCVEGERRAGKHGDWILSETWHLIKQRPMLQCSGHLCQVGGRRLTRLICASLKQDREARMASVVGSTIKAELTKGNIQEAFRHLKGWYRAATETQAKPCYWTMVRQTLEQVDLYARRQSPGDPLPVLVDPVEIVNNPPEDGKIRSAVARLSNGRAAGASGMRAEDVKGWLLGI